MGFFREISDAAHRGVSVHGELRADGPHGPVVVRGEDHRLIVDVAESAAGRIAAPPGISRRDASELLDAFVRLSGQTVHVLVGGEPAVSFTGGRSLLGRVLGLRETRPKVHSFRRLRGLLRRR